MFTGGEWVHRDETFMVANPANQENLASVPNGSPEDMKLAINSASRVQNIWANTTATERGRILSARLMREKQERLAKILTLEEGKPIAEAKGEIAYAISFLDWFAEEAKRIYGDTIPSSFPDKRIVVIKRPVGVCLAITP